MQKRNNKSVVILAAQVLLATGTLLAGPRTGAGQGVARAPVAATPHFAFYSELTTNLNDALLAAGVARNFDRAELFHSGAEATCFDALAPSARAGWDRAVDYYAEIISPTDFQDRQQYLIRTYLFGDGDPPGDARAARFVVIAEGFWAAARPAYEACRWSDQDRANRQWIERAMVLLATHHPVLAPRLEALYQTRWRGLPILVDVVETVSWSGANTIFREPAGGHILISNAFEGPAALEIVFHEASHLLVGRASPLQDALAEAASALDLPLPGDLWHPLMFYTTGEAVRRSLADAGVADYTPMIFEIFGRSSWGRYREAIEHAWPAYLEGQRTLSEAATDLLRAIGGSSEGE